jgi:5-methylcytosine-specific restriction endonuclease McrA
VNKERSEYEKNKVRLYEIHDYDPRKGTKNVHHVVFRCDGGGNDWENLALLDKDFHDFIHQLVERIDRNA